MISISGALATAQDAEQLSGTAETPGVLLSVALIGVLGIALGGVIQLISQRWVVMYDRMAALRSQVGELSLKTVHYSGLIVQSARTVEKAHQALREDPDDEAHVAERAEKHLQTLVTEASATFRTIQTDAIKVMSGSDHRLSEYAGELHSSVVAAQNEVSSMFHTSTVLTVERAVEIETSLDSYANVLINMIAPRKWEVFWRFRGAKRALREFQALRTKQLNEAREKTRGHG